MDLNRRQFFGVTGKGALGTALAVVGSRFVQAGAIGATAMAMESCNVFSDILNWVPVGEAALNSILSVLTANGVLITPAIQGIVTVVEAGFTSLTAAVKEYRSTTPPPVGSLAKVETAFKDIVDNFGTFIKSLGVSNSLFAIVVGLANIVFSTIAAFMNQLPAASSLKRTVVIGAVVPGTTVPVVPKLRTRRGFKRDFNDVLHTGPKLGVVIPASAELKLSLGEHLMVF